MSEQNPVRSPKVASDPEIVKLLNALADVVVKAVPFGEDKDGFIMHYVSGTGAIHAAIPLLAEYGIHVRPGGADSRVRGGE